MLNQKILAKRSVSKSVAFGFYELVQPFWQTPAQTLHIALVVDVLHDLFESRCGGTGPKGSHPKIRAHSRKGNTSGSTVYGKRGAGREGGGKIPTHK